jgi:hypothetical protein
MIYLYLCMGDFFGLIYDYKYFQYVSKQIDVLSSKNRFRVIDILKSIQWYNHLNVK